MHTFFKLEMDKSITAGLDLPAFEAEEIDYWLNEAIRKFVKTRYSGQNLKGESFEQSQKRIDDLRTLIEEEDLTPSSGGSDDKPNSFIASLTSLSETYWMTISEEVIIQYTKLGDSSTSTKRQGVTQCTADTYRSHIDDPYSEHILHYEMAKPLRLFKGDSVELITDGNYDVTKYWIRYLKKPTEVVHSTGTDCDLPDHTHNEIVKIAANMALENVEQPRYQTHVREVGSIE